MRGVAAGEIPAWSAPSEAFVFGDEAIRNTRLLVGAVHFTHADMVLGADFFARTGSTSLTGALPCSAGRTGRGLRRRRALAQAAPVGGDQGLG